MHHPVAIPSSFLLAWLTASLLPLLAQDRAEVEGPSVLELVRNLGAADAEARREAEETLSHRGLAAVPDLLALLEAGQPEIRRAAAEGLAVFGPGVVGSLAAWGRTEGLAPRREILRVLAAEAGISLDARRLLLGTLLRDPERGLGEVIPLLGSDEEGARVAAAHALGSLGAGARAAIPALTVALDDSSDWVRINVIQALGLVLRRAAAAPSDLRGTLDSLRKDGELTAEQEAWLTAEAAGLATADRREEPIDPAVADGAAERLWTVFSDAAQDPAVRRAAAVAIARIGGHWIDRLIETLERPETLALTAEALADLDEPPVAALTGALTSESRARRVGAAVALAEIGPRAIAALAALVEALQDPDRDLRLRAAWAVGELGLQAMDATPALLAFRERGDRVERIWADFALMQIDPLSADRIMELLDALQAPDATAARHARDALALLDHKAVVAVTRRIREAGQAERARLVDLLARLPVAPAGLVPVLIGRLLNDPAPGVRVRAAAALAVLGSDARMALAALRDARTDADPRVRAAARAAISRIEAGTTEGTGVREDPDR